MAEELTTAMHSELLGDEVSDLDLRVAAVFGSMNRGATKEEALAQYQLTEQEYDDNIDRVLNDDSW